MQKRILSIYLITALLVLMLAPIVRAESIQISVSGNGEEADNVVSYSYEDSQDVSQENSTQITNSVVTNSQTGGNTASDNIGNEVTIGTGSITESTEINNQGVGNVIAGSEQEDGELSVSIADNGAESSNTVTTDLIKTTNYSQDNQASITNTISKDLNTGRNQANDNLGNVTITTGSIDEATNLQTNVGLNVAPTPMAMFSEISLVVDGNGSDTTNEVNLSLNKALPIINQMKLKL